MRSISQRVVVALSVLGIAGVSRGAVAVTTTLSTTSETTFPANPSDQVNQDQTATTFLSQSFTGYKAGFGSGDPTLLNNGVLGAGNNIPETTISLTDFTTTFHFRTDVNILGYDLSDIKTIAAWPDNRVDQKYDVYYSTYISNTAGDDSTGYTLLTPVSFIPHPGGSNNSPSGTGGNASQVDIAVSGISGVNAVQFRITAVPNSGVGGDAETVYREFDILATPTVAPEPSSLALCALGGIAMLSRRRQVR